MYGIPVSGGAGDGWLISHRTGPAWLSGGVFGAEASVMAMAMAMLACGAFTAGLVKLTLRRVSWCRFAAFSELLRRATDAGAKLWCGCDSRYYITGTIVAMAANDCP